MTGQNATQPVVVTTEHRGVFFGYLNDDYDGGEQVELLQAQMCVYWSADVHGVLGLGATGPSKNCKITPAVPSLSLNKVTAVIGATPEAVTAWQAKPWSR